MLRSLIYHGFVVDNSQGTPEIRNGEFIARIKRLVKELWSDVFNSFLDQQDGLAIQEQSHFS